MTADNENCYFCGVKLEDLENCDEIIVTADDSRQRVCSQCLEKGMEDGRIKEGEE